ncbi:MAG: electron transfer flavoprotein subunit beta/FixA family protein [Candidatus Limnocylindrales bacterium]
MRIVVLLKPVPDTTGQERLGPDLRVDRGVVPAVMNPNDEYALEGALRLMEARGGDADITLLTMGLPNAPETIRKGLAMGAHRGVLVTDPALAGSCSLSTARVLAAALGTLDYDLVLAGVDTSDGRGGVVAAGVAALRGLPYLSYAGAIELGDSSVRVHRSSATGYDVLEAPLPAMVVATQAIGEPRYPSRQGLMGARSKEIAITSLADIGLSADDVGGALATTQVLDSRPPAARAATRVIRGPAPDAARQIVDFLAERRII